jgi:hypothetical protein
MHSAEWPGRVCLCVTGVSVCKGEHVCVLVPTARRCLHEAEVVTFMVCIGVYVTGVQCQTPTRLLRQRPFLRSFTSVVFLAYASYHLLLFHLLGHFVYLSECVRVRCGCLWDCFFQRGSRESSLMHPRHRVSAPKAEACTCIGRFVGSPLCCTCLRCCLL